MANQSINQTLYKLGKEIYLGFKIYTPVLIFKVFNFLSIWKQVTSQIIYFQYQESGWNVYDPVGEYKRLGLDNESWTISKINEKYALCDTYPQILGLPSAIKVCTYSIFLLESNQLWKVKKYQFFSFFLNFPGTLKRYLRAMNSFLAQCLHIMDINTL